MASLRGLASFANGGGGRKSRCALFYTSVGSANLIEHTECAPCMYVRIRVGPSVVAAT